jgi:hypothetical protein
MSPDTQEGGRGAGPPVWLFGPYCFKEHQNHDCQLACVGKVCDMCPRFYTSAAVHARVGTATGELPRSDDYQGSSR